MKATGSQIIVKLLELEGISMVAGIPGGSILPLYDELNKSKIKHILVRQEQAAGFIAQGITRSSGKPAVCMATSGPGAMNLLTAIADARCDSVPIVAFTGQVNLSLIGTDAFQEADTFGLSFPITKHSIMVKSALELLDAIPKAFEIAVSGRPGPVLIDVPRNVQTELAEFDSWPEISLSGACASKSGRAGRLNIEHSLFAQRFYTPKTKREKILSEMAQVLLNAKKCVFYLGGGCNNPQTSFEINKILEKYNVAVVSSLMGIGAVPVSYKYNFGMLGMHGSQAANRAMFESDVVLALGVRFDDRATGVISKFCPNAKILHIDIDAAEINKILPSYLSIVGDLEEVLPLLDEKILAFGDLIDACANKTAACAKQSASSANKTATCTNKTASSAKSAVTSATSASTFATSAGESKNQRQLWLEELYKIFEQTKSLECGRPANAKKVNPRLFIKELPQMAAKVGISEEQILVTTDVGQHQMWAAQYYPVEHARQFLTSGSLGTMGFGLPTAIGAALANPKKRIICITGDGSILMNIQELATLRELNLNVTIIMLQNGTLGMVRQQQEYLFKKNYSASIFEKLPDYLGIAKGFYIDAIDANSDSEWYKKAFSEGPHFVKLEIEMNENVLPFVPGGKANIDAICN